jgi:rRNA maturation endonuclease Nob1
MKLTKEQSYNYRCDICKNFHRHKDMYDEKICYDCYDHKAEIRVAKRELESMKEIDAIFKKARRMR